MGSSWHEASGTCSATCRRRPALRSRARHLASCLTGSAHTHARRTSGALHCGWQRAVPLPGAKLKAGLDHRPAAVMAAAGIASMSSWCQSFMRAAFEGARWPHTPSSATRPLQQLLRLEADALSEATHLQVPSAKCSRASLIETLESTLGIPALVSRRARSTAAAAAPQPWPSDPPPVRPVLPSHPRRACSANPRSGGRRGPRAPGAPLPQAAAIADPTCNLPRPGSRGPHRRRRGLSLARGEPRKLGRYEGEHGNKEREHQPLGCQCCHGHLVSAHWVSAHQQR